MLRKTSGPLLQQVDHKWTDAETALLQIEQREEEQSSSMERGFEYRPKTSFAGHEGSRPTERRPMQRSMSLSNGLQRRDSQRVVIRPDPAFTKFDPENDGDDL